MYGLKGVPSSASAGGHGTIPHTIRISLWKITVQNEQTCRVALSNGEVSEIYTRLQEELGDPGPCWRSRERHPRYTPDCAIN